jgi:hypothetical protein
VRVRSWSDVQVVKVDGDLRWAMVSRRWRRWRRRSVGVEVSIERVHVPLGKVLREVVGLVNVVLTSEGMDSLVGVAVRGVACVEFLVDGEEALDGRAAIVQPALIVGDGDLPLGDRGLELLVLGALVFEVLLEILSGSARCWRSRRRSRSRSLRTRRSRSRASCSATVVRSISSSSCR